MLHTTYFSACVVVLVFACGHAIAAEADTHIISPPEAVAASPTFSDKNSGITMVCPNGWVFMTPGDVRERTHGKLQVTANTLIFCVDSANPDQNINVRYTGDARGEAPTNDNAKTFLLSIEKKLIGSMRQQFPGFRMETSRITAMADGYALDLIFSSNRGDAIMGQRSILLIANGKAFTITCTAPQASFVDTNSAIFDQFVSKIAVKP